MLTSVAVAALFMITAFAAVSVTYDSGVDGAPGDYNVNDIAVINSIIKNNGLNWSYAPADGSSVPADWTGVIWENGRIIELHVDNKRLMGTLDISGLERLTQLRCTTNYLTGLNASGMDYLEVLHCYDNHLTYLEISGSGALKSLACDTNRLTELSVAGLEYLEELYCNNNNITELDLSGCISLQMVMCRNNSMAVLNVAGLENLETLYCFNNRLTELNVAGLENLADLQCYDNHLTKLDVSGCISMEVLALSWNYLTELNVAGLESLKILYCDYNELTELDASYLENLEFINCQYNLMKDPDAANIEGVPAFDGWDVNYFIFSPQRIPLNIDGLSVEDIEKEIGDIIGSGKIPLVTGETASADTLVLDIPIGRWLDWRAAYTGGALELKGDGEFYVLWGGSLALTRMTSESNYTKVNGGSITVEGDYLAIKSDNAIDVSSGGSVTINGNIYFEDAGMLITYGGRLTVNGDVNINGSGHYLIGIRAQYPTGEIVIGGDLTTSCIAINAVRSGRVTVGGNVTADGDYAIGCFDDGFVHVKGDVSAPYGYGIKTDRLSVVKIDGKMSVEDPNYYIHDAKADLWWAEDEYSATNVDGYSYKYTDGRWVVLVGAKSPDNSNTALLIAGIIATAVVAIIAVYVFAIRPRA